jgi:stearoyl-CoA desaturase (delta-9 desaturase)
MFESLLAWLSQGALDLSVGAIAVITLVMVQITIASVTIYLHRSQAHRGVDLHPVVSHFFRLWLWFTTGMVTKDWVSVHRKHHAKCETEEDPHSPQILGIRKLMLEGAELYRREADKAETLQRYGHGTPDDWLERRVYSRYRYLGIVLMLGIDLALFGALGLTVWAVQMLWIPFWAAGVINGMAHYRGYRNYETADAATNLWPLALWIGGEELHNNHHAFPSSAKFSSRRWEFDIGWMYIRTLSALGLARVKKVAPKPRIEPGKELIDLDTLRAVVVGRLHVMSHYARDVVLPVARQALADSGAPRRAMRKVKNLLVRDERQLDDKARGELARVLRNHRELETVYQFRERLQALWSRTTANHEALIQGLKEWCVQAEATGIHGLQNFARSLRGYSLEAS